MVLGDQLVLGLHLHHPQLDLLVLLVPFLLVYLEVLVHQEYLAHQYLIFLTYLLLPPESLVDLQVIELQYLRYFLLVLVLQYHPLDPLVQQGQYHLLGLLVLEVLRH